MSITEKQLNGDKQKGVPKEVMTDDEKDDSHFPNYSHDHSVHLCGHRTSGSGNER
jgi:hypothetical protein